ncbi:hypothetical protein CRYUN_Cryun02cG0000500 [Craigia yunnanensis]
MDKKRIAVPLVCHGHSRPVVDLFYSPFTPDVFFLISDSKDSSPMLRNGETGDWIGTFEGHKGAVWSVCLDTNALHAASGSADFTVKVWDALTGDELHSFEHKHIVRACAFSELNFLPNTEEGTSTFSAIVDIFSTDKAIRADTIILDTHLLLTGGVEKVLRIYDLNCSDAPPREVDKSPGSVRTVAWMHSDQTILSSCTDMGGVRFWDVRSGKFVQTLETKSSVTSAGVKMVDISQLQMDIRLSSGMQTTSLEPKYGNKFIAGGEDMWVCVFDFHTGGEIACNKGHHGPVHSVRFSPGGESYASGSEDGTIRIWQTGPDS